MEEKKLLTTLVGITLLITLLNALGTYSLYNKFSAISGTLPKGESETQNPTQGSLVSVSTDDDPVKGNANAPVTIIEFSDFQCPFCSRFITGAMPQIEEKYIKTGKAKLVFRDYPLPFHQNAQKASEAAQCANEQEKFWEMHDKLFTNQSALALADLKKYAKDLKLDTNKFNTCLDSNKYADEVKKDLSDGASYGIGGTPSFFIAKGDISVDPEYIRAQSQANQFIIKSGNATVIIGAQPFSEFEKVIEEKLKE